MRSGRWVVPSVCVLVWCSVLGCGPRSAAAPRPSNVSDSHGSTAPADTGWIGLYTGTGDLYQTARGWSRSRPTQVSIGTAPGLTKGRLAFSCSILSDSLLNYGCRFELAPTSGMELRGEAAMQGQIAHYELQRQHDQLVGVVKIFIDGATGLPESIYTFSVTRSTP